MDIAKTTKGEIYKIDPRNIIVVEGFNSRTDFDLEELISSIRENGVKNPISVIPETQDDGSVKYKLVDGERRYRACMKLIDEGFDLRRIPALFLSKSLTQEELLIEQLIRNEGKRFNEYEMGIAFRKFVDLGFEPIEITRKLGLAPWKVVYLTHTERDPRIQKLMAEGRITGAEVRKVYQAHGKEDEAGAVKEILSAAKKNEKKGKKNITLSDLDVDGKTIAVKDTAAIKKGFLKFLEYYKRFSDNGRIELELSLDQVIEQLAEDKSTTIVDIFEDALEKKRKADIENGTVKEAV